MTARERPCVRVCVWGDLLFRGSREEKKGTTGYSAILLTAHGDRTALIHRGVSAQIGAGDIPWKNLSARWIFVTSLAGNMKLLKRLFTAACARGIRIAFNPGMQELRRGL